MYCEECQDQANMLSSCVNALEKEVEQLREATRTGSESLIGLQKELDFVKGQHAQTLARKSNLMRDWLADQTTKWKLRCQIRGAGDEPIT